MKTQVNGCSAFKDCKPVAKAADTYYVGGGYYGGMSEEDIIRELRANGPVLFDFEAGIEFQVYSSGIIVDPNLESVKMLSQAQKEEVISDAQDKDNVTDRNYQYYNLQWEHLTHSTLLIGWGYDEELDMKYWVVRNSYGYRYGEGGNLRVRRGTNDFGCEGEMSAITP